MRTLTIDGVTSRKFHDGIDIGVVDNTPVYCVADGTVLRTRISNSGYGNIIYIQHSNGIVSFYAHNTSFVVTSGEVQEGQHIANSGHSGTGTGPHIHFGIHENNQRRDPLNFNWETKLSGN